MGKPFTDKDRAQLVNMRTHGFTWYEIGREMNRHPETVRTHYRMMENKPGGPVAPSPYPVYDEPLEMEGDALIMSDTEFPFHHAEFINKCLDIADIWGIKQLILAGDGLHFDSLSRWEPAWTAQKEGITETVEGLLMDFGKTLPARHRDKLMMLIGEIGNETGGGNNVAKEVEIAREALKRLGEQFERVDYVLGNHDGRFLSALKSPLFADDLLRYIGVDNPKWRIAPYYFSYLHSGDQRWRIEHPKSAAKLTAAKLASKYLCNVVMGHSHYFEVRRDASGHFWAIHTGHCVDERRLPYAAQRSTNADAHSIAATIIRDGYPYLLTEHCQWDRLKRMA